MLKLGLTGGIACGKSTVGEMLRARGAHIIQADLVAHDLMQPGQAVYDEIVRCFGQEILAADGTIDRAKLAQVAFAPDAPRVAELNQIVHPAVLEYQQRWLRDMELRDPNGVAVVEAALILEAGARKQFDKIIVVTCRPEQKVERLALRLNIAVADAEKEVARRSAAQMSDEEKIRQADFVIDNSGSLEELDRKVEELWRELRS